MLNSRVASRTRTHAPGDRPNHIKDLKQHSLGDGGIEFADIERSRRSGGYGRGGRGVVCRSGRGSRRRGRCRLGRDFGGCDSRGCRHFLDYERGVRGRYCFMDFSSRNGGERRRE